MTSFFAITPCLSAVALLCTPLVASAQFLVTGQSGQVSASASCLNCRADNTVMTLPEGQLSSASLATAAQAQDVLTPSTGFKTNSSGSAISVLGESFISVSSGGSVAFQSGVASNQAPNGNWSGGGASGGGTDVFPFGGAVVASISVAFDVLASTAVSLTVSNMYVNSPVGYGITPSLTLSRVLDNGRTELIALPSFMGTADTVLAAGHYLAQSSLTLNPNKALTFVQGRGYSGGGSSLSISAVPEPASWALMGLGLVGLVGLGLARRRGARAC